MILRIVIDLTAASSAAVSPDELSGELEAVLRRVVPAQEPPDEEWTMMITEIPEDEALTEPAEAGPDERG
jgi:hypothetical protein